MLSYNIEKTDYFCKTKLILFEIIQLKKDTAMIFNLLKSVLTCVIALFIFVSCIGTKNEKKMLTVSILPQKYFAEKIVGDKMDVMCMVPAGSNPEAYDPSPNQLIQLDKSVAYLAVGNLGFELAWLGKLAQNHPELKIFNTSNGVSLINAGACSDSHSSAVEHPHIGPDPHIWSSPKTARMMAQNIYRAVVSMDSINITYYQKNLQRLLNEIDSTDIQIELKVKNLKSRSFLIYHPALTYLARDYHLTQMSVEFNGKEPTPQHLKHLIDIAHQEQIKVIFVQKEFDVKNASILSQEAGCKVVVIDPLSYQWSKGLLEIVNALTHD